MSTDHMRQEFEGRFRSDCPFIDGEYVLPGTRSCIGEARIRQFMWESWQASRAALVVELPETKDCVRDKYDEWQVVELTADEYQACAKEVLESAGITVKP